MVRNGQCLFCKQSDNQSFYTCSTSGNGEMANLLIQHGANVDLRKADGRSPLHVATIHGNLEFAEVLIKNGAAVDAVDQDGVSPLQLAVLNGIFMNSNAKF